MSAESDRHIPSERVILVEAAPPNSGLVSLLHLRRAVADGWKLMIVIFVIAVVAGLWSQSRKAPVIQQKAWLTFPSFASGSGLRTSVVGSDEQMSAVQSFLMPRLARQREISDPVGNWFSISSAGITMVLEVKDESPQGAKTKALVQLVEELIVTYREVFQSLAEELAMERKRVLATVNELLGDRSSIEGVELGGITELATRLVQIEMRLSTMQEPSVRFDLLEELPPRSIGLVSVAATLVIAGMFSVFAVVLIQLVWWFMKIDPEETT
ncbi:hypothetical protein OAG62_00260 [bacterium]|nr:hypothetical protein [bacterium]